MRALISHVVLAMAGFGLGFAATHWLAGGSPPPIAPSNSASGFAIANAADPAPPLQTSAERIKAALAFDEKTRRIENDHALYHAIQKLSAAEMRAGAAEFAALMKQHHSWHDTSANALCEAWLTHWLEIDAPGALQWLETSTFLDDIFEPQNGPSVQSVTGAARGIAFKTLARHQPEWVRKYLAAQKPGARRDVGVYHLLQEIARQDAGKAREGLESFSAGENRAAAILGYVGGLAASDVRASFQMAISEGPGLLRAELVAMVLLEASKRGVETTRELVERIDDPALRRRMSGQSAFAVMWNTRDDILPWIEQEAQRPGTIVNDPHENWTGDVGQALVDSGTDIGAIADWAASLENDSKKKLLSRILGQWSNSEPAAMKNWLKANSSVLERSAPDELPQILASMTYYGAPEMRAWTAELPPGLLREQAQFQLALRSGDSEDVDRAMAAYPSMAPRDSTGAIAKELATTLARKDPEAAARWVMELPAGVARPDAIAAVVERWTDDDPHSVATWLKDMPPGADRDVAIREYAGYAVYADPAAAAEWVEKVEDPVQRAKAAEKVFSTWRDENPGASRQWLRELSGVDEKWRAEFLRNWR